MTSIATMMPSRAPPRNISHVAQSGVVAGADGGGGGDGDEGGDDASTGSDWVVKAEVMLQALRLSEPIALTFQ